MEITLDPVEQRVLGSLLEKERTVPDTYPMTLNGLRTACNQSSGRDPVLALSESEVRAALDRLRPRGLTRVIHPSHGARQPKFRQVLDEVLDLEAGERAVLTLLLLRGPQTPGELRSRAERLHPFGDRSEVETALAALAGRETALVEELERLPGQKERRWVHRLGESAVAAAVAPATPSAQAPGGHPHHYEVTVNWTGDPGTVDYRSYSRNHLVTADGAPPLPGSSDPTFRGDSSRWNPEQLLIAALSQCHMLAYLHLCATNEVVVTAYSDRATGTMVTRRDGSGEFTEVTLHPVVTVTDESMRDRAQQLHGRAAQVCFIARSVNFPVHHEPVSRVEPAPSS